ncbi:MAG: HYR domain-containing protein [Patescibacteria group bacterium]
MSFIIKNAVKTGVLLGVAVLAGFGFTASASAAVLEVTSIETVRATALPGSTFENGLSWKFNVTIPDGETNVNVKVYSLIDGGNVITAVDNARIDTLQAFGGGASVGAGQTYKNRFFSISPALDLNPALAGIQIQLVVDFKLPETSVPGSYSFNYTITSEAPEVIDTEAPVITPRGDVVGAEAIHSGGTYVVWSPLVVTDNHDIGLVATCNPDSASLFPLGTTLVTCTATDVAGNTAQTTFNIVVVDTTAPVITPHANVTVGATSAAGAVVAYSNPTASDEVGGNVAVTCAPISGSVFPVGNTTVNCSATDAAGNTANSSFVVTVTPEIVVIVDTTAPVIAPHGEVVAEATGPTGAAVTYTLPSVTDNVNINLVASCSPVSGSVFALGTTLVTCTAIDAAGNSAQSTTFNVVVEDTTAPTITLNGASEVTIPVGGVNGGYIDPRASAYDLVDGEFGLHQLYGTVTSSVPGVVGLDIYTAGTYYLTFWVIDNAGNESAHVTRTVTVEDEEVATTYTITTNLPDVGGSVTPGASVSVNPGQNQTITIVRNPGYEISGLTVDGQPIIFAYPRDTIRLSGQPLDGNYSHTFNSVNAPHTITATFIARADDDRYVSLARIIDEELVQIAYAETKVGEYPELRGNIDTYQAVINQAIAIRDNQSSTRRQALDISYAIFAASELFYEHPIFY